MTAVVIIVIGAIVALIGNEVEKAIRSGGTMRREKKASQRLLDAVPPFIYFLLGASASIFSQEIRALLGLM